MQSTKSIYKKPFEKITTYEECTWLGNDKPFFENDVCAVFRDKYAVTQGHLLFIAKQDNPETVSKAYKLALEWGQKGIKDKVWDGFNVGQNIGRAAGQSIMWPHVHLIPRHDGDSDPDKHNGIRLSYPNGNHTNYY